MISSALFGSKRGISDRQAPTRTELLSPHVWPNVWNSGSAPSSTSSSDASASLVAEMSQFVWRLSWLSSAPLGVPVVPDV